jgi:hypothetical protein
MTSIDEDIVGEQWELLDGLVPAAAAAKTSLNSSWIATRDELRDEQAARACESWANVCDGYRKAWSATANLDIGEVFDDALKALGAISTVVAL